MADELTVSIVNQTDFSFDSVDMKSVCWHLWQNESLEINELSIALLESGEMARVNDNYHGKEGTTDVLSFDYGDGSGEILIDPARVMEQSARFDHGPDGELYEVLIHGLLHLSGYNHDNDHGEHLQKQKQYVEELS